MWVLCTTSLLLTHKHWIENRVAIYESANNVDTILSAREKAASLWLEWALDSSHTHRPGAAVNGQYVYDSKYKINAYGVLLDIFVKLFGQSEGEQLAAADSGPIDEAYVGGGS